MRTKFSKILSILLCLVMVAGMLPTVALAETIEDCTDPNCTHAAAIGDVHYDTLAEAIAAVPTDGTETTIKMLSDITEMTTDQILTIASGQNVVLDMDGHSITVDSSSFEGRPIVNKGTLKVTGNGTIDSTAAGAYGYGAIRNDGAGVLTIENGTFAGNVLGDGSAIRNEATCVINGGDFTGTRAVVNESRATTTINGGNFHSTACSACGPWAYCIYNKGNITFNAGTVTAVHGALAISAGNGTVNGGTFETVACKNCGDNTAYYAVYVAGEKGAATATINDGTFKSVSKAAIHVGNDNTNGDGGINAKATVVVKGGTFISKDGVNVMATGPSTSTPSIQGGTFSNNGVTRQKAEGTTIAEYVPSSTHVVNIEGSSYTIAARDSSNSEAKIGDTYYNTLAAAIAAAQNGDTVTLLADATIDKIEANGGVNAIQIAAGSDITIDLNGHTITKTGPHGDWGEVQTSAIVNRGTLTIKDLSTAQTGKIVGGGYTYCQGAVVKNYGTLNIEGGRFESGAGTNGMDQSGHYVIFNLGTANITSGEFFSDSTGTALIRNDKLMNISGGTFEQEDFLVLRNADTTAVMNISGEVVVKQTNDRAVQNYGTVTIEDGEFNGNIQTVSYNDHAATTTIVDGIVNGRVYTAKGREENYTGDVPTSTVTVTGGTFSSDPTAYVAGSYIAKKNSETEYAVIAKSGLTSGVYMSDPTKYTAANYYATNNGDGTWTVFFVAPYVAPTYSITVENTKNGDVTVSPKTAAKGTTVTLTVVPDKGYEVDEVTVTDQNGNPVEVTNNGDGTYTFKQPSGKVTVTVTFQEKTRIVFVDVPASAYYYDAVLWAAENGITGGVDDTHFAPNAPCTRAQVVTFLWRAAGSPEPKSTEMPFVDVPADAYYHDAVLWAVEQGITKGTSDTTFSPDATCTRGQIVTFLWRSQKSPSSGSVNPFTDVAADNYYADAVLWAVKDDITNGTSSTTFSPDADCTRAQIVTFLYRCLGDE